MTVLSCREARELVSDYIDGELAEATATALEEHLQTCPNCPPLYASLVQTLAELKVLGEEPGADEVTQRVVAALTHENDGGDGGSAPN